MGMNKVFCGNRRVTACTSTGRKSTGAWQLKWEQWGSKKPFDTNTRLLYNLDLHARVRQISASHTGIVNEPYLIWMWTADLNVIRNEPYLIWMWTADLNIIRNEPYLIWMWTAGLGTYRIPSECEQPTWISLGTNRISSECEQQAEERTVSHLNVNSRPEYY